MWIHLEHRSLLKISGQNVLDYLQGLLTQDLGDNVEGRALYSLILTPKGRCLSDLILLPSEDSFYMLVPVSQEGALMHLLSFYRLGRPFEIEKLNGWGIAADLSYTEGPLPSPGQILRRSEEGILFQDPRSSVMGRLYMGDLSHLELSYGQAHLYKEKRLFHCIPESPWELLPEKSIPLENRMQDLPAISWNKGCYLGQELTSRTKYVGEIRKNLFSVFFESELPASLGDRNLYKEGRIVGHLLSWEKQVGIGQFFLEELKSFPFGLETAEGTRGSVRGIPTY